MEKEAKGKVKEAPSDIVKCSRTAGKGWPSRNSGGSEGVRQKRDTGCDDLQCIGEEKDGDGCGCGLCSQTAWTYAEPSRRAVIWHR
ncbi:unnamed protein product [Angiostrongylus costaricensis]|uniref:Uncharacterized protein n=1 Tax=Angiostrongylus costaricensis TaxID=334426 RepID=A0A0R3Q2V4_ANGCS|nr:unnamed protein product [Angiostrongylus costaricensis]